MKTGATNLSSGEMLKREPDVTVAMAFARVDASQNPNQRSRNGEDAATAYFRCMVVAYSSFRRFNPNLRLTLITDSRPLQPFAAQLNGLRVEVIEVPFSHRPPEGFSDRFTSSLYLLDAVTTLKTENALFVDPDVLCVRALGSMVAAAGGRVAVLPIAFDPDKRVIGLSGREAGQLHEILGELPGPPVHLGGEMYLFPRQYAETIQQRIGAAWELTLKRHSLGQSKFWTEEHIMNYVLRGVPTTDMRAFVRRIWTAHSVRYVDGSEKNLTLWHLPAEKDRGFASVYPLAIDHESWFWTATDDDFVERASRAMGLHHRKFSRFILDMAGRAWAGLHSLVSAEQDLKEPAPLL